jgi:hypothetical protein
MEDERTPKGGVNRGVLAFLNDAEAIGNDIDKQIMAYKKAEGLYDPCDCCGKEKHLCQDHDHATNLIRGKICRECNFGLGWFYDDPSRLISAVEYLRRWQNIHSAWTRAEKKLKS